LGQVISFYGKLLLVELCELIHDLYVWYVYVG
jgi:hypothetical protein